MAGARLGAVEGLGIARATVERWSDLVTVFGTRGDPSWCWCQFFLTTGNRYRDSAERNRADLEAQVREAKVPPGLLAYRNGEPIGWLQLGPRTSYPRVTGQAALAKIVGDRDAGERVWRTTCFVVRAGHRKQGVAGALLAAGVEYAAEEAEAGVLERLPGRRLGPSLSIRRGCALPRHLVDVHRCRLCRDRPHSADATGDAPSPGLMH